MRLHTASQSFGVGIALEGDKAKAELWLPWARNRLQRLLAQADSGVRTKVFNPQQDVHVEITASTNTALIRIIAGNTVYLDSGFYNHIAIAPKHELAFVPSQLVYGSEQTDGKVQGKLELVKGYAVGETLPDLRQSKPMGANKPLIKTAANGYESATSIYADDDGLLRRKRIQAMLKPSNWQGLTRLWIQCLYGSLDLQDTYDIPAMSEDGFMIENQPPVLAIEYTNSDKQRDWLPIPHRGMQAPWIMGEPGDRWRFWLVTINSNKTATFRKLSTKLVMNKSATHYSDLQKRQALAAIFAGSRLSATTITVPIAVQPIGDTLYYGWAADDNGHTAKIVGHALWADPPSRYARSYTATVQFDDKGRPAGLDVKLDEEAHWDITSTAHCLYVPVENFGVRYAQAQAKLNFYGGFDCDAPLLARSTAPDYTPEVIRIIGTSTTGTVGFSGAGVNAVGNVSAAYNTPLWWTVTRGPDEQDAFDGNGISGSPDEFYSSNGDWWLGTQVALLGLESDTRFPPITEGGTWETRRVYQTSALWVAHHHLETNVRDEDRPLLIVPFDDAESLVSGLADARSWDYALDNIYSYRFTKTVEYQYRFTPTESPTAGPWEYWGTVIYNEADQPGQWATAGTGALHKFPINGGNGFTGPGSAASYAMTVHAKGEALPVANPATGYFSPSIGPLGNPFLNPSNIETTTGAVYRYSLSLNEADSRDWPTHTANAVGWA